MRRPKTRKTPISPAPCTKKYMPSARCCQDVLARRSSPSAQQRIAWSEQETRYNDMVDCKHASGGCKLLASNMTYHLATWAVRILHASKRKRANYDESFTSQETTPGVASPKPNGGKAPATLFQQAPCRPRVCAVLRHANLLKHIYNVHLGKSCKQKHRLKVKFHKVRTTNFPGLKSHAVPQTQSTNNFRTGESTNPRTHSYPKTPCHLLEHIDLTLRVT